MKVEAYKAGKRAFFLLVAVLMVVAFQWGYDEVLSGNLQFQVPQVHTIAGLESRWTYFYLHLFTFIPVFVLSFDRKVHYYKKWKYLLPATGIVGVLFILWDVFFSVKGVWGFNEAYLSGVFFLHLPIEEWLFFFTVPFACVFIYECLNYYVSRDLLGKAEPWITPILIGLFFGVGVFRFWHMYTATTFLLSGGVLLFHYVYLESSYRSRFYFSFLVSLVPFWLVNGVLTGGFTQQPVVLYNPEEYLGIRIISVPLDDAVYSFLLLLGNVTLFEAFRKKSGKVNFL